MTNRETTLASIAASIGAIALCLAAIGCGEKQEGTGSEAGGETEQVDLALDFFVNPDHAGIYEAIDSGYFAEEGLEVTPRVPSDPSAPIKQLAAGRVDLAVSYEPEVMLARAQGLDVIAVAAIVPTPLTSLVSLPDAGIDSPADLAGGRVITAGIPYQTAFLESILEENGVDPEDVDQVSAGLNLIQPLLAGNAEATLGAFSNIEGVQLEEDGEDPRVMPVDELGIPTYDELVLVASGDRVRDDPDTIQAFIAALARGTEEARGDPASATDALLEASPELDPELTRAQVEDTVGLLSPAPDAEFGRMDPAEWESFADFLVEAGQLDSAPPSDELLTNELLPASPG